MVMEHWRNDFDRRKLCPSAALSTNLTWTDLAYNLCVYSERPVTDHMSYGTAFLNTAVNKFGQILPSDAL